MAAKPKDSHMNAKGGKKWTEGMKNLVLILTTCQLTIPIDDTDDMEVSEEPTAQVCWVLMLLWVTMVTLLLTSRVWPCGCGV